MAQAPVDGLSGSVDGVSGSPRLQQLLAQGALEAALVELEQLLQQSPTDWGLWQLRGELAVRQMQPEAALLAFEQALELNPRTASTHAGLGRLLLSQGALDQARRHLEAARAFEPEDLEHTLVLVELYLLLGERGQALNYLKEALSIDAASARAYALLGGTLYLFGRWPEARDALRQSLELDPACESAYLALLQLALKKQDYLTALQTLLHCELPPDSPQLAEALYLQACCQYWQGDLPAARNLWRSSLALGGEEALLPLALAAPLVSQSCQERRKWLELVQQGAQLLKQHELKLSPEWPLTAWMPEAEPELSRQLGEVFQARVTPLAGPRLEPQACFRLGLITSRLDDPAIQDQVVGLLREHRHQGLDWQLFYLHPGELPEALAPWTERCFQVPDHADALCRLLGDFQLSALLFLDLGLSLYALALRAPIPLQLLLPTWPEPSGLASLPLASAWLGLAAEPLLALPRIPDAAATPAAIRAAWDLPRLGHLYLCALEPEYWLPEFDALLLELLGLDRKAFVIGLQKPGTTLHTRVMQRQAESLPDRAHRVRWLELPPARLPELVAGVDLLIEPFEAGNPWASFQALASGVPVLSCPGQSLRSRLSRVWLERLQLPELALAEPAALPAEAVALVTDRSRRAMLKERLLAGREQLMAASELVAGFETRLYTEMMRS
ncbi:MAG: tetratricopeptide repeat protein [Candidatus Sericytochromatia bacterium]